MIPEFLRDILTEDGEGTAVEEEADPVKALDQLFADAEEERALILALLQNPRVIRRLLERLEAEGR